VDGYGPTPASRRPPRGVEPTFTPRSEFRTGPAVVIELCLRIVVFDNPGLLRRPPVRVGRDDAQLEEEP
jgi:hypothetical protein